MSRGQGNRLRHGQERETKGREVRKEEAKRRARFLLVGGGNTVIGFTLFPVAYSFFYPLGVAPELILAGSYISCSLISFFTQKIVVFRTKGNLVYEAVRFIALQLALYVINIVALPKISDLSGAGTLLSQAVFTALVIIFSYIWHTKITFRVARK